MLVQVLHCNECKVTKFCLPLFICNPAIKRRYENKCSVKINEITINPFVPFIRSYMQYSWLPKGLGARWKYEKCPSGVHVEGSWGTPFLWSAWISCSW